MKNRTPKGLLALLMPKRECPHDNVGTSWKGGVKKVICNDCRQTLYAIQVSDPNESDPAKGC